MPRSNISRISLSQNPLVDGAARAAKEFADKEILLRLQSGRIQKDDYETLRREHNLIYQEKYREYYYIFSSQESMIKVVHVPVNNPAGQKYLSHHTIANFSKLNYFVQVEYGRATVRLLDYPLKNKDLSPETQEAFLDIWPGPLDRPVLGLKNKLTDYVDTLLQKDSRRRLRYPAAKDDQRKTILDLLLKLLNRDGKIDDGTISKLLLKPEQLDITEDESPLKTITKYLLLGQRGEAIRFARTMKLWEHAYCLFLLEEASWTDYKKLLVAEHIESIKDDILNMLYRSLLAKSDLSNPIKSPDVSNDAYRFAILSANDCQVDFYESNEIFKLIIAVKSFNPHLISLGFPTLSGQGYDVDDFSYDHSHISYNHYDTHASRTLTISTIDMLILNEIWEYCLNLANHTCNGANYMYNINLVPYKLVFASKLLDYGKHEMFEDYLHSIQRALSQVASSHYRDPFYDWDIIGQGVEHLSRIKDLYNYTPQQQEPQHEEHELQPAPLQYNPEPYTSPSTSLPYIAQAPQMIQNIPQPFTNQEAIREEASESYLEDGEPPSHVNNHDYSNGPSRRQSASQNMPLYSPPSFELPGPSMATSSPMNNNREPSMGESFTSSPFSPINEGDNIAPGEFENNRGGSVLSNNQLATSSDQVGSSNQQSGILTSLFGGARALLPKSNSKPMILPDDSSKPKIVWDAEKNSWVDTSHSEGVENNDLSGPPPVKNLEKPPMYSFGNKPVKSRYPKP